jgi:demethylmenaquinone methyltransferase/2-methoxy-6-polyprenyl-1,4-benzoquinol methylase
MSTTVKTRITQALLRVFASDHPIRRRFSDPEKILNGAGVRAGERVLEVGCGRGFFTLPLATRLGDAGSLVAVDVTQAAVDCVANKVKLAGLSNVRVVRANALETRLPAGEWDRVLLFGVVPSPTLPLSRLLAELHRLLKPAGELAVWTAVPGWSPQSVTRSGLFRYNGKSLDVHNFSSL